PCEVEPGLARAPAVVIGGCIRVAYQRNCVGDACGCALAVVAFQTRCLPLRNVLGNNVAGELDPKIVGSVRVEARCPRLLVVQGQTDSSCGCRNVLDGRERVAVRSGGHSEVVVVSPYRPSTAMYLTLDGIDVYV